MYMKRFTIKQQSFFMILFLVVIIGVIGFFVVLPAVRDILSLQMDITQTYSQLDQELQRTRRLRRSLSEFQIIKAGTKTFSSITIKPDQALKIIDEMETIAPSFGLNQTISVEIHDQKNPADYSFSFVNTGTLEQHLNFLKALELLPYYVMADHLSWSRVSGDTSEQLLTLRFTATIYADTFPIEKE